MAKTTADRSAITALGMQADSSDLTDNAASISSESKNKAHISNVIASNLKVIIVAVLIVIAGSAATIYYMYSAKENEMLASLELSRIRSYYDADNAAIAMHGDSAKQIRGDAIVGLQQIVEQYGSSNAGKSAALYAGNLLVEQNKIDDAQEYFERASSSASPIVSMGAKAALALCKEKKNDFASAAELYSDAAKIGKDIGMEDRYKMFAAINYEKSNDKEKAIALYTDLVMKNSASEFSANAKNSLARLGTIIE